MEMDRIRETFNDGVLFYGRYMDLLSGKKKRIGKEFAEEGKLFFRELNCREQDYITAEAAGSVLDIKVKTPYPRHLKLLNKSNLIVKIHEQLYEVIKVDSDKYYLYFYLMKVGDSNS